MARVEHQQAPSDKGIPTGRRRVPEISWVQGVFGIGVTVLALKTGIDVYASSPASLHCAASTQRTEAPVRPGEVPLATNVAETANKVIPDMGRVILGLFDDPDTQHDPCVTRSVLDTGDGRNVTKKTYTLDVTVPAEDGNIGTYGLSATKDVKTGAISEVDLTELVSAPDTGIAISTGNFKNDRDRVVRRIRFSNAPRRDISAPFGPPVWDITAETQRVVEERSGVKAVRLLPGGLSATTDAEAANLSGRFMREQATPQQLQGVVREAEAIIAAAQNKTPVGS